MEISERNFEETVESALLAGGPDGPAESGYLAQPMPEYGDYAPGHYRKRPPQSYDRELCLDPEMVVAYIQATQPQAWATLSERHGSEAGAKFLRRLADEVSKRGVLDVFREGVKDAGIHFDLYYPRPSTRLNPDAQELHRANIFSVVRQLRYSAGQDSIDMALFLNGLPTFTAELKNPLNGQNVNDAIRQYRQDRDSREPLLSFGRCLAHFAVDPELVYVTTKLEGPATEFLPFNRGSGYGAGNPPVANGFATAYLWEHVWAKDSALELIQRFIQLVVQEDDKGRKIPSKKNLVFPRFHQLDAVRRLVADAKRNGTGEKYLIQHSAGSGKSNTIAWLAHQLSILHDAADERIFDSIIVMTDRRVLDRQLQKTVKQFERTLGLVENIDKTSRELKDALEAGKQIIVTTLQKFPQIVKQVSSLPGQQFAVVIDEAHSSQSGETPKAWKDVLAASSLEEAEKSDAPSEEDAEDKVVAAAKARGPMPNVSMFAFTATPKQKTLELFGTKGADGKPSPFSLYSMRQAIEENFIMDVLQNYTTYKTYWNLLKKVGDDPRFDKAKAAYLLKFFVDHHEHAIARKVAIMVEHFHTNSASRIKGRAKAMIVTRSRLHAVRTKLALEQHLQEKGYPYKALVAFSGTVKDGGKDYTEQNMNSVSERQTATVFKQADYRFLVVAEKFQTGFNEPMLHTMYVDKKLAGLHAVQTLSRLNRVHPDKAETVVLDFANEADDIRKAFEPYYERVALESETDPNLLYDVQRRLMEFDLFEKDEVSAFADVYFGSRWTQDRLYALLRPVEDRFNAQTQEVRDDFRGVLSTFVRLYAFLAQVMPFADADLERLYHFARYLERKLKLLDTKSSLAVEQYVDLASLRIEETSAGTIDLGGEGAQLKPMTGTGGREHAPPELEPLSEIIQELNRRFGTEFKPEDRVFINAVLDRLGLHPAVEMSIRVNTLENARLTFDHVVSDILHEMADTNFELYKRVTEDDRFSKFLLDRLFEQYRERLEDAASKGLSGLSNPELVEKAVEAIVEQVHPRKVILFGSAARGEVTADSDYDFIVVIGNGSDRDQQLQLVRDALSPLGIPNDVLICTEAEIEESGHIPGHVIHEALLDGRILYDAA